MRTKRKHHTSHCTASTILILTMLHFQRFLLISWAFHSHLYVELGFVDLWGSFVGRADMYMKDGLHLSGKGAAVFADELSAAVDSGMGTMTNIFGSKHCLN